MSRAVHKVLNTVDKLGLWGFHGCALVPSFRFYDPAHFEGMHWYSQLGALPFRLLTAAPLQYLSYQLGNIPSNWGISIWFRSVVSRIRRSVYFLTTNTINTQSIIIAAVSVHDDMDIICLRALYFWELLHINVNGRFGGLVNCDRPPLHVVAARWRNNLIKISCLGPTNLLGCIYHTLWWSFSNFNMMRGRDLFASFKLRGSDGRGIDAEHPNPLSLLAFEIHQKNTSNFIWLSMVWDGVILVTYDAFQDASPQKFGLKPDFSNKGRTLCKIVRFHRSATPLDVGEYDDDEVCPIPFCLKYSLGVTSFFARTWRNCLTFIDVLRSSQVRNSAKLSGSF